MPLSKTQITQEIEYDETGFLEAMVDLIDEIFDSLDSGDEDRLDELKNEWEA